MRLLSNCYGESMLKEQQLTNYKIAWYSAIDPSDFSHVVNCMVETEKLTKFTK